MVRVSECQGLVAAVYESSISIQKSKNYDLNAWKKEDAEAEFTLTKGKYVYLEWSSLYRSYFEKPSFLTLDDKGVLRLHYVKEKREQVIREGEGFRSATFSLDGSCIYAINDQQEICKINLQDSSLLVKRKIHELSDSEELISSHIQQLTPWMFVIGSLTKVENEGTNFMPYLHLVSGDIADENGKLQIKAFETPLLQTFESKKPIVFRTLYLKERQLLIFGHTESYKVRVLKFASDFQETEIEELSLGGRTLKGMVFMKEGRPRGLKNEYQNKTLESSKGPQLLVLDSEGFLHHFRCFDANSCAPTLSLFTRHLTIQGFAQKQEQLRCKFNRPKRYRYKSSSQKAAILPTVPKKKHSKSQTPIKCSPSGVKSSSGEKQKTIRVLKGNASNGLFKQQEDPFLSVKKTENKPIFPTTNGLFSAKIEDKPASGGLFSSIFSPTKTTGNSLFNSSVKPNFSFQKSESRNESTKSLFGPLLTSDLFSKNSQSTTSNLLQSVTERKKREMLFLNKLESDVTFKVEGQEFPAHKFILIEKYKFFKNMFSSGMSESYAPVIEINDIKASMFRAFLQYIYMGQAVLNEELAMSLLELSEKYIIDELKSTCEDYLKRILTLNNCFKIFEAACLYEADSLKERTIVFLEANFEKVLQRKDFEDLPKSAYVFLKRIQWNKGIIFDPSFDEYMKNIKVRWQ